MKPASFPEQTGVYAHHPDDWGKGIGLFHPIPVHMVKKDLRGRIYYGWRLNWFERVHVLVTGRIWQTALTFGGGLPPQYMSVRKPYMEKPDAQA